MTVHEMFRPGGISHNQEAFKDKSHSIDPFTVDRTGDSNGVFETMRREICHFNIVLLSLHFARFLCINILEHEENLTGPTLESEELIICFCSF